MHSFSRGAGGDRQDVAEGRSPQPPLTRGAKNESPLIEILEATRGKTEDEVGYVGGNAATLLVKVDKGAIEGRNLSRAVIIGADFTNANLRRINFAEANLADSVFTKILGSVWSVAFSPDSKLLVTGDTSGVVRLWDAASRKELLVCKGHIGETWVYVGILCRGIPIRYVQSPSVRMVKLLPLVVMIKL